MSKSSNRRFDWNIPYSEQSSEGKLVISIFSVLIALLAIALIFVFRKGLFWWILGIGNLIFSLVKVIKHVNEWRNENDKESD